MSTDLLSFEAKNPNLKSNFRQIEKGQKMRDTSPGGKGHLRLKSN